MTLLKVDQLHVYYGDSHVIRGVSLELVENETIAIMGRNGMGKTTLLKALMGLLPVRQGTLRVREQVLTNSESYRRVAAGMGFIPQGRMIFPYLTVEENLLAGMETLKEREIPQFVYDVFPVLQEMKNRKGGNLSGGQQQQLAIARALATDPKILLLDEPTEGIQPNIVKEIEATIHRLNTEVGITLVLTEQHIKIARELAHEFVIMDRGRIEASGDINVLTDELVQKHLTI